MRFDEYFSEVQRIETLAPEQEAELWRAFKEAGDDAARRRLIESYQPLVFKIVLPYRSFETVMDLVQEGTVGLIEAVERYDYTRGVAFSLYALHRIRGRVMNCLKKECGADLPCLEGAEEDGISWKEQIADEGLGTAEIVEERELVEKLREAMLRLPARERQVLEQVCIGSAAVKEVAAEMEVSASYIYHLQKMGIKRVRGILSRFMSQWR